MLSAAVAFHRRDQFDPPFLEKSLLELRAVPGFVSDQSGRKFGHVSSIESSVGEHTVVSVSICNSDSEWKTIAVRERHDLGGLARTALPNAGPPFFAGT